MDMIPKRAMLVAGARPNFMKIAPLYRAFHTISAIEPVFVHTGQHYDHNMSDSFIDDMGLPRPKYFLNVGSDSHGQQTAAILAGFEKVCSVDQPDLVVVVGDVNSTLACALAAKKLNIPVAHVEAGLRSFDMSMPEEINRKAVDAISDLFFVTEASGCENLLREGAAPDTIHFVGNLMIDTLLYQLAILPEKQPRYDQPYALLTLHRPSNVDNPETLKRLLEALAQIAKELPIFFPVHPRTRKRIEEFDLAFIFHNQFERLPPLGYRKFLHLLKYADLVITDSGGMQEETTALAIPCFTLRNNTERPATVSIGTNMLLGSDPVALMHAFSDFRSGLIKSGRVPDLWDGQTAQRITCIVEQYLNIAVDSS